MEAKRNPTDVEIESITDILTRLRQISDESMLIITGGEPLLREDIDEIIRIASDKGFITVLGTGGVPGSGERMGILKRKGLRGVSVSLDSPEPQYHDTFRGSPGSWKTAMQTLESAKEAGLETQINVTLTDGNWQSVEDMVELGVRLKVKAVNFFFIVCTGRASKTFISTRNYGEALKKIIDLSLRERRVMVRPRCAPHVYRFFPKRNIPVMGGMRGCPAGRYYIRVDHRGNVYPCPYMPVSVGNILREDPEDIWFKSPLLQKLREENYSGKCGVCEFKFVCGGCRARALTDLGNPMGSDPLCDHEPQREESIFLSDTGKVEMSLKWSKEAVERVERIPLFIRSIVINIVEKKAKEEGLKEITPEFLEKVRRASDGSNPD